MLQLQVTAIIAAIILSMEEILQNLGCIKHYKTIVNNGINYQPQLVLAGFRNHQQYENSIL